MTQTAKNSAYNLLIMACFVVGYIPTIWFDSDARISLSPFVGAQRKIYWVAMYWCTAINFVQLSLALKFSNRIDDTLKDLVLTVCLLDMLHLLTLGKKDFGIPKIALALFIVYLFKFLRSGRS